MTNPALSLSCFAVACRLLLHCRSNMRCVCTQWFDTAGRSITMLRPSSLPVLDLVEAFPSLKTLDLSHATKVRRVALASCT
jgi:hypothetical protein